MAPHTDQLTGARALTRRFGEHVVLDRLDLSIAPGEFVPCSGAAARARAPCCAPWPGSTTT